VRKVFPKISIITPSFNQGKFIKKTIDSVLSQNYPDLEYVVIDGGSTDNTVKILKSYGNKIKWISEKDKGQADAINKGLKIINGEIIAFINSDDYYLPDTFKKIVDFFKQNITCNVVTGDYLIINENGKPIQSFVGFYKIQQLSLPNLVSSSSKPFIPLGLALFSFLFQPLFSLSPLFCHFSFFLWLFQTQS